MRFDSIDFAIFLPIFFVLYWFFTNKNLTLQNSLIVISSYIFYGWWDWRFLSLIIFSTIIDFIIGENLFSEKSKKQRQNLLSISLITNLGLLGVFKYYNFFIDNFISAFSFFGTTLSSESLNIILPVGISFYTFQTLSYTIDIYNKKLKPTSNFLAFSAFVSFFPQLVAGPIERANNLLPQFFKSRKFNYEQAKDGLRQMLWGVFKKVVIADNSAQIANQIFNNSDQYTGSTLAVGAFFLHFKYMVTFQGTQISQLAHQNYLDSN